MFDVSIIMPVYNVENHLERAIQSALNQTKQNCEIILVNDGSTDDSGEICDTYARKEPLLIQVIHQENQGSGAARNAGLEIASGEYIYFADPDDYFEPTLVEDNIKEAEEKEADMVVFGYTMEHAEGKKKRSQHRVKKLPKFPYLNSPEKFRNHFRNFYLFSPYALWNKLYRREFLVANGIRFTEQSLGQDALFNIETFHRLGKVAMNRKAYYHYVMHKGSAVNRYRPDRFALEYNIAQQFDELIHSWEMEERFKDLITKEYWQSVYLELANVTHMDCPMEMKEKVEWMQWIMQHEQITQAVEHYSSKNEKNPFRKLLVRAIKTGQIKNALLLMQTRHKFAMRFNRVFDFTRTVFQRKK